MKPSAQKIVECRTADEALTSMCHWFYEDRLSAEGCTSVEATAMPDAYRRLLVHNDHMTTQLEAYHGRPVELRVLHFRQDGDIYSRNVLLALRGSAHVVEFGIVRMDLQVMPAAVREEVLSQKAPLGDILINHRVLRRIEPKWYFRFEADSPLASHFGPNQKDDVFGRMGIIYCEDAPGIELLEVITDGRLD